MLAEIERRTGELEQSNLELAKEVKERARAEKQISLLNERLEERVRVLERIATDPAERTAREIEALRDR